MCLVEIFGNAGVFGVGFEQTEYTVSENERTVQVCVTMETVEEISSVFVISYTDHSARGMCLLGNSCLFCSIIVCLFGSILNCLQACFACILLFSL